MNYLARLMRFAERLLSGEDVVLVHQTPQQWDAQFALGRWDRLESDQPNTTRLAALIRSFAAEKGMARVLDVGCGNGGLATLLVADSRIVYHGIDLSATAVAKARELAPTGVFTVADASVPPPEIGIIDVLVFNEVFFYLDALETLKRYKAHTHPDTLVVISVLRSWRTPFIWHRINRLLSLASKEQVSDHEHTWDMATAHYL